MNVYLCGSQTRKMSVDWKVFKEYEDRLVKLGVNVMNPLRTVISRRQGKGYDAPRPSWPWGQEKWQQHCDLMSAFVDISACQKALLMPNWDNDDSAILQYFYARELGLSFTVLENGKLVDYKNSHNFGTAKEGRVINKAENQQNPGLNTPFANNDGPVKPPKTKADWEKETEYVPPVEEAEDEGGTEEEPEILEKEQKKRDWFNQQF